MKYIIIESYRRLVQWLVGCELFEFPGLHALRVLAMRSAYTIGKGAKIGSRVRISRQHHMEQGSIRIGRNVTLANGCCIDMTGQVEIEDNVTISSGVQIVSHKHDILSMANGDHTAYATKVEIGYGAWIGTNAIILPGVKIGQYAVVGAGAVVTHDVPEYMVVAGNPARPIRDIRENNE